jgi:hypothetical protein
MTKPIQLHVGYVGVTREGERVEIVRANNNMWTVQYPWTDDNLSWRDNGEYHADSQMHNFDIVGPWVEPVKTPINYNDGKWHQWNGSECPVHPNSTVQMVSTQSVGINRRAANSFDWDHELDPILAFRVTNEFLESTKVNLEVAQTRIDELKAELVTTKEIGLAFEEDAGQQREQMAKLESAYAKLLDQAESMSVMMQCPWKEGSHAQVAWRKEQDKIFNEFWDDDEVDARDAFKEKT